MNIQLKENFDQLAGALTKQATAEGTLFSLGAALVFAGILCAAYRLANTKMNVRPQFAVTLVVLAFVSTILMSLIRSNLALSLGMLGALSIVRFRTNIRDPRDIGFIFWSMAIGIAAATESYAIGFIGCFVLSAVMIATKNKAGLSPSMLLVIRGSDTDLQQIQDVMERAPGCSRVKAKNVLAESFELVYEVQLPQEEENGMIHEIFELGGIDSVNLLASNTQMG
ncbi:DUF4956 domain-containing protein [Anaerovorax odorimutans]|uniref:DUF4956 domain-containing protein n=1 Tax=Anaerovorax odorimutans TaxID=109327 RepID=A0ABT1RRT6_9FIRM|nr:DUF4956 domain-containing protein [Anaerovorax odorimutans]MCQ4637918.1 DUF4956 domain-containing protein [Anaerovorax odorimutans]